MAKITAATMDTPTTNNITLCWMDLAIMELIIRELRPSSASVSRNCTIKVIR